MRPLFHWNFGTRSLELGQRTLIMGVLNVTPDSFSDGGHFLDLARALEHASRLLEEGADIIDVGGESTRPGAHVAAGSRSAPTVSAEEELSRVIPVITEVKKKHPGTFVSIDTYKAEVARAAVNAGAEIVNDVSGFRWDPQMAVTIAELNCGAVLMHMRGRPEEWRTLPPVGDVVPLVNRELKQWAEAAIQAGIRRDRIMLDPGFGFGKSFEENYPLVAGFEELHELNFPLLAGVSRKSFIGRTVFTGAVPAGKVPPQDRLYGTLAAQTALILEGAHIIRTHDVRPSVEAARIADAILRAR